MPDPCTCSLACNACACSPLFRSALELTFRERDRCQFGPFRSVVLRAAPRLHSSGPPRRTVAKVQHAWAACTEERAPWRKRSNCSGPASPPRCQPLRTRLPLFKRLAAGPTHPSSAVTSVRANELVLLAGVPRGEHTGHRAVGLLRRALGRTRDWLGHRWRDRGHLDPHHPHQRVAACPELLQAKGAAADPAHLAHAGRLRRCVVLFLCFCGALDCLRSPTETLPSEPALAGEQQVLTAFRPSVVSFFSYRFFRAYTYYSVSVVAYESLVVRSNRSYAASAAATLF